MLTTAGEFCSTNDVKSGNATAAASTLPLAKISMTARTQVKLLGISRTALPALEDSALFWKAMYLDVSRKFREFGERTFTRSTAVSYETYFLLYLKEREYQVEAGGQVKTRIQAFLEQMGK